MTVAVALVGEDKASKPIKDVTTSLKGMEQQAEHTGGVLSGLTGMLGKIGLAGLGIQTAIGAVSGIGGLLTGPIQKASDLAESQSKVNVVFGDSAKIITDFAKTSAQNLGQSQAAALGAAGSFGNLFVSMGLGQKPAADLSTKIVTLGSDLASFNNIDPAEALDKLRAGLVGEAEPLRALGVNLTEATVADEALRLGLGKDKKTLTEAAKIQARYSLIVKQTATAHGDFAETSTGLANATRIISASFEDIQTEIGNRLLPVIAPLVAQFARYLPQAMDAVRPYLDRAGKAIQGVADTVGKFVKNLREQGLIAALRDLGREVGPALMQGLRAVQDFAGSVVGWLREQFGKIDWRAVWSAATGFAAGLVSGLGSIVGDVVAWLKAQWAAIPWAQVWASVTNIGAGLVARLGTITADVVAWLKTQWAGIAWSEVWTSVKNVGQGLAAGIGSIVDGVTTWLVETWKGIDWGPIWKAVEGHGKALVDNLAPIVSDVEAWLVKQFSDIDWVSVWSTARAGTRLPEGLITVMRSADTQPLGRAIGFFLVDAIKEAITFATGANGGFAGADALMAVAFMRSMLGFPVRVLMELEAMVVRLLANTFEGAVERLNLTPFWTSLKQKVTDAIAAIYPLKIGPLTLSLSGVSVNVTGITGGPAATPGLTRDPSTRDTYTNAKGGLYRVAGSGGTDSQMVSFRATPGESVAVGRRASGGAVVVNQTFNVANRSDAEYLADVLPDALARALEKARSQQGLPVVSGLTRYA